MYWDLPQALLSLWMGLVVSLHTRIPTAIKSCLELLPLDMTLLCQATFRLARSFLFPSINYTRIGFFPCFLMYNANMLRLKLSISFAKKKKNQNNKTPSTPGYCNDAELWFYFCVYLQSSGGTNFFLQQEVFLPVKVLCIRKAKSYQNQPVLKENNYQVTWKFSCQKKPIPVAGVQQY